MKPIQGPARLQDPAAVHPRRKQQGPSFGETLSAFVNGVDFQLKQADRLTAEFAVGERKDIHEVMITSEKAGISFKLLVEIRNNLIEAYKEIMRMQF